MNEQTQAELMEWIRKGGEFVEREAPQYAAEVVAWHAVQNWIGVVVCGSLMVASLSLLAIFVRMWISDARSGRSQEPYGGLCLFALAGAFGFLIGTCVATCGVVKAKVAPRVVVMEALAESLK